MLTLTEPHGWQYSTEFHLPRVCAAVQREDTRLEVVWNRKYKLFQIVRHVPMLVKVRLRDFGTLAYTHVVRFWEMDVEDRHRIRGDQPDLLIADMRKSDTRDHPELLDESWVRQKIIEQRHGIEAQVRDKYQHNQRFNRRQIHRLWGAFLNSPGYVK